MKETIQSRQGEVSIVIYDSPLPPRYFKVSKKFLRTLLLTLPLCLVLVFLALFLWGLGSRVATSPRPKMPVVLSETDSKVQSLESEIEALKASNTELVNRLQALPASGTQAPDDVNLVAVKKPYGMQNLTSSKRITLDQFTLSQTSSTTSLKFQIISSDPDQKVTGHIIVLMLSDSGLMAYPRNLNTELAAGIKYSAGEPFSVSRLRPTNAEFLNPVVGKTVKFVIYIFSREGDLLLTQETTPFAVEAKP